MAIQVSGPDARRPGSSSAASDMGTQVVALADVALKVLLILSMVRVPAHASEVAEAEGVRLTWLSTVTEVGDDGLTIERMELDDAGFPQSTGRFEHLDADALVLALGQESDLGFLAGVPGLETADCMLTVDHRLMTGRPGVFAGGDMVPDVRSATYAVGHGRRAATSIDAWLRGAPAPAAAPAEAAAYERLNTWYYTDAPRAHRTDLEAARRSSTFAEVVQGFDRGTALDEARRCLSCGSCFSCDNCFGMCPDDAVVKTGDPAAPYVIDLDYCKGCGICAAECPAGAITMLPEPE